MAALLGTNTLKIGTAAAAPPLLLPPPALPLLLALAPSAAVPLPVRFAAADVKLKPERASSEEKRVRSVVELRGWQGGGWE